MTSLRKGSVGQLEASVSFCRPELRVGLKTETVDATSCRFLERIGRFWTRLLFLFSDLNMLHICQNWLPLCHTADNRVVLDFILLLRLF